MRTFLALLIVLAASITASATSYATGEVAGHFGWYASTNSGIWTPRIPDLPHFNRPPYATPYMYPSHFSNATLSVTCSPVCGIGNTFSLDLSMTNFYVSGEIPNLNVFAGTLNLITKPIILTSTSGLAIARFTLSGNLLGCTDVTCANPLFSLIVNNRGYADITYTLSGGQLTITSVGYTQPEPASITLLGTGLALMLGKIRHSVRRRNAQLS